MFPTASYPITANRFAPHSDYIDVEGYDFTSATFKMQVRDTKNGGAVRADVVPTAELVVGAEVEPTTRVSWAIDEATMEAMPLDGSNPDADKKLYYDLHITPSGGTKFVAWGGDFIVKAGVTE